MRRKLAIEVTEEIYNEVVKYCSESGDTFQELMETAIKKFIEQHTDFDEFK